MEEGAIIKHEIGKSPRTGDWRYMKPEIDKEKCIGCATCVPYCPEACISMINNQGSMNNNKNLKKAKIDYDFCKGCGVCSQVCPVKAVKMLKSR